MQIHSGDLLRGADLLADRDAAQTLDVLLERTRDRWQLLRPWVPLRVNCAGPLPPPAVVSPQTIGQTLISLLNNAADACPEGVELAGRWDRRRVVIEICDRGPGPPSEVVNRVAKRSCPPRMAAWASGCCSRTPPWSDWEGG